MDIELRLALFAVSLMTLFYMIRKIRHSKLQIEYAIFWLFFAGLLIILSVFPQLVYFFAGLLKIESPANLIFAFIIFIILIKSFMMTIEISQLENKVKELTQEIAIEKTERAGNEDEVFTKDSGDAEKQEKL